MVPPKLVFWVGAGIKSCGVNRGSLSRNVFLRDYSLLELILGDGFPPMDSLLAPGYGESSTKCGANYPTPCLEGLLVLEVRSPLGDMSQT